MRIFWSKFVYTNIHSVWAKNSNKIPCTFSLEKIQLMCSSKNKNLPFLAVTFTSGTLLKQILKMFCMAMQFFQIKVGKKCSPACVLVRHDQCHWRLSDFSLMAKVYTLFGKLYIALKLDNYFSCMQWDTVKFPKHFFLPNASDESLWQMINPSWFWHSEVFCESKILE